MRIFVADGNSSIRLALQIYLQYEPGLYVTGMASEAEGLLVQVEASRPDLLLLDSHLPGGSMQDLLRDIRGLEYPTTIIVLSLDPDFREPALLAGADGFIYKKETPDELLALVRSFAAQPNEKETDSPSDRLLTLEDLLKQIGTKGRGWRVWKRPA